MNVVLFGASGMVGQGVLRECLLDPDVQSVLSIGRSATGARDPKLRELVHRDFTDFSSIESQLSGFEACFFCLGVSSVGLKEGDYRRVSYDFTMAAARVLVKLNPGMTFVYVSGTGTDSSERGRTMWARVKGKTENDLFRLPFRAAYMFRPGVIVPLHGIKSRTKAVRVAYAAIGPLLPLVRAVFPKYVTTTELLGRAMINAAKHGAPTTLLENADINELGRSRVSP
ncbi:MAG: epimerase [Bryobacteraceae bacterium]|jgi:uncharacterized protein YbjT (DUF2867 family)